LGLLPGNIQLVLLSGYMKRCVTVLSSSMRRCTPLQEKQGEGCVVVVDCHVEGGHTILPFGIYLGLLDYMEIFTIYPWIKCSNFQFKTFFENI